MTISDPPSALSRRFLLATGLAAVLNASVFLGPARADASARAQDLVAALSQEMMALLRGGRSDAQLVADFERILSRYGDMQIVAASVLGPPWRGASSAQKQAFTTAFQGYLARKYGKQFRDYDDASVAIRRARDGGKSGVLVETAITRTGRQPFAVEWQVSERSGAPRVVNLIIEGVSLLTNERAEVGALLEASGGNVDRLISTMNAGT